jgi:uncharacterized protein YndB with AHSA1/START domain
MGVAIEFEVSGLISASPEVIYGAWLNSEEHSKMTGSPATVSATVGGEFDAWDGYIRGVNLELESPWRILQRWRSTEFEDSDEDSLLEILFETEEDKTRVTIRHTSLPEHGMQYKQGWIDAYFTPMETYFLDRSGEGSS